MYRPLSINTKLQQPSKKPYKDLLGNLTGRLGTKEPRGTVPEDLRRYRLNLKSNLARDGARRKGEVAVILDFFPSLFSLLLLLSGLIEAKVWFGGFRILQEADIDKKVDNTTGIKVLSLTYIFHGGL